MQRDDKDRKAAENPRTVHRHRRQQRKEAEKLVHIGDPITLDDEFDLLRNDLAIARAFDNRIGTFAVAETLRLLKESQSAS